MNKRMKKKKTLWNGVSVLIAIELVIMAFARDYVQLGLMTLATIGWSVWAIAYYLVPYVKTKLDAREARKLREHYEAEERKLAEPKETNDNSLSLCFVYWRARFERF